MANVSIINGGDYPEIERKKKAIEYVSEEYNIKNTIEHLTSLMHEVSKKEVNYDNVNAACNCVNSITELIKTSLKVTSFLSK